MLLSTENLRLDRRGAPVLSFPDISLAPGETLLLLGPSGAGKTSLLSILCGLLPPSSGRVTVDGNDFYAMGGRARDRLRGRHFGFVFQALHLLPALTLRQNIALAADMAGLPRDDARISGLLERLDLGGKAGRRPSGLSQGEQQRAALARALVNGPAVILADEPTSALDDGNAHIAATFMAEEARRSNAALLVATHDARLLPYFDRTLTLPALSADVSADISVAVAGGEGLAA